MTVAASYIPSTPVSRMRQTIRPMVLANGNWCDDLHVMSYTCEGPLDERTCRIEYLASPFTLSLPDSMTIAVPWHLEDESAIWQVLVHGNPNKQNTETPTTFEIMDTWSAVLERSPANFQSQAIAALPEPMPRTLRAGENANRSTATQDIAGQTIYVTTGQTNNIWTVGETLQCLNALAAMALDLSLLPTSLTNQPLPMDLRLSQSAGQLLKTLCETFNLVVQRQFSLSEQGLHETRQVQAKTAIARITLTHGENGEVLDLRSLDGSADTIQAKRWMAYGAPPTIETTQLLHPAWLPALEGETSATYDRQLSNDFSRYANVYRRWVLNETGKWSQLPYEQPRSFHPAVFFDQPSLEPTALQWMDCLTLDNAGVPLPPIVELSMDGGTSWLTYPGPVRLLENEAGIYLDGDTLPPGFIDAVNNATAAVRITGSLRSPSVTTYARWQGNPFTGETAPQILHGENLWTFKHIDTQSKHATAIEAGVLQADINNDSHLMQQWLLEQMDSNTNKQSSTDPDRINIQLLGSRPWLSPGQRLSPFDPLLNLLPESLHSYSRPQSPLCIQKFHCVFSNDQSAGSTFVTLTR